MDDAYLTERAQMIRKIAETADPFTKKRLVALAEKYDAMHGRLSQATRQLKPDPES
jgi:hypothetical protein